MSIATSPELPVDTSEQTNNEMLATSRCDTKMQEVQRIHADWFELFEDTLPDSAPREEVIELMLSAPNDFALGLMYGKFTLRLELEAITGRAFQ